MAFALALLWRRAGRRGFGVMALLWLAYAVYEYLMVARVLCSGECNIRIDLLLIYPLLIAGTLWLGLVAVLRAVRRRATRDA